MATITSKQDKTHGLVDPVSVLVSILLIAVLLVPASLTDNLYGSVSSLLGKPANASLIAGGANVSFAADAQYWDANCSFGWSSDAACDAISTRAQFCSVGISSLYCSEYDTYLQQFK